MDQVYGRGGPPKASLRRLNALIVGLPVEAVTFRADRPNWTQQDELMATAIEVTDAWGRAVVKSNGVQVDFGEPLRIEHPDRPKPSTGKTRKSRKKKGRLATASDIAKERR